jgi:hypothetical protein
MYFDGSKRVEGARAGVVLISMQGDKLKYVMRMSFPHASNNEAEYEALLHGMRMAKACGATCLKIFGALVEKGLLVAHQFELCVAHIATPLVKNYPWRISICTTHSLPFSGAYPICAINILCLAHMAICATDAICATSYKNMCH